MPIYVLTSKGDVRGLIDDWEGKSLFALGVLVGIGLTFIIIKLLFM